MDLDDFVKNLAEQFNETDPSLITPETKFKELEEWSSLISLSLIAMADEKYNVKLKGEDIKKAVYVKDLYDVVNARMSS
jgi:acyl carrier protein